MSLGVFLKGWDSDDPKLHMPACGGCGDKVDKVNDRDLCPTCEPKYCKNCGDASGGYEFCDVACMAEAMAEKII